MRRDTKLILAFAVLVLLFALFIVVTVKRQEERTQHTLQQTTEMLRDYQEKLDSVLADPQLDVPAAQVQPTKPTAGTPGKNGTDGRDGQDGADGEDGAEGKDGTAGRPGDSAYEVAVKEGFRGSVKEWLSSLMVKGDKGDPAPLLKLDCVNGIIMKSYEGDSFWEQTKIKCEVAE